MLNRTKLPEATYDVFTKKEGRWTFTERVVSQSTEAAKRRWLAQHPEVPSYQCCVYHRK